MTSTLSFQRQTFAERGHSSNHFTLFPVRRLVFGASELEISNRIRQERIPYSSLSAEVLETYAYKTKGTHSGEYIEQTLVSLKSPRRTYRFDLSNRFPDFKERKEILHLLRSRVMTTDAKQPLSRVKRKQNVFVVAALIACLTILAFLLAWQGI